MEFLTRDDRLMTGEVWSPGPVARSVWVLLPDGSTLPVRLPKKAGQPAREVTRGKVTNHTTGRVELLPYLAPSTALLSSRTTSAQIMRMQARNSPPLEPRDWRQALSL
jgi:hypothetical protein